MVDVPQDNRTARLIGACSNSLRIGLVDATERAKANLSDDLRFNCLRTGLVDATISVGPENLILT